MSLNWKLRFFFLLFNKTMEKEEQGMGLDLDLAKKCCWHILNTHYLQSFVKI